jgi:DNA-binding NarL/FixJ family response regulator
VDDHRELLEAISTMLADDFDVAGVATDGRHALDTVRHVHPDVIVLDVEMPGFDGFQMCRALEQAGPPTIPVVFLSMHDGDDYVSEAFRCGGRGYVLKSRTARDLVSALDQALRGRSFVPSLTSLSRLANGDGHAMLLHDHSESSLDELAALFDLALQRGDATCVIATEPIREGLGEHLRARGWDVGGSSGHKRYLAVDAADALNRFMRNGRPDADRLAEIAAELNQYRVTVAEGASSRLTIFGNMVVLLGEEGNTEAVLALENMWNTLTHDLPFLTLCGYTTSCFHQHAPQVWSGVCEEHWALSHGSDV